MGAGISPGISHGNPLLVVRLAPQAYNFHESVFKMEIPVRTIQGQVCSGAARAGIVLFLLLGAAATPAFSQMQPATVQADLQAPAADVTLDLAVRDRHNKPVLDLRADQISVTDSGAPVKSTDLRLVSGKQQSEPLITLLFDRPATEANRKDSENFLFGGSVSFAQETSEGLRRGASKFLKSIPASATGFQFAVMDIWGRLQIQEDSTSDRRTITEAVSMAVEPGQYGTKVMANAVEERMVQIAKMGQDSSGAAVSTRERAFARPM
jgi:hypothetical protein